MFDLYQAFGQSPLSLVSGIWYYHCSSGKMCTQILKGHTMLCFWAARMCSESGGLLGSPEGGAAGGHHALQIGVVHALQLVHQLQRQVTPHPARGSWIRSGGLRQCAQRSCSQGTKEWHVGRQCSKTDQQKLPMLVSRRCDGYKRCHYWHQTLDRSCFAQELNS